MTTKKSTSKTDSKSASPKENQPAPKGTTTRKSTPKTVSKASEDTVDKKVTVVEQPLDSTEAMENLEDQHAPTSDEILADAVSSYDRGARQTLGQGVSSSIGHIAGPPPRKE